MKKDSVVKYYLTTAADSKSCEFGGLFEESGLLDMSSNLFNECNTTVLADLCDYVKGKTAVSELNEFNYISTENMLPDKNGITQAASLPSVETTQAFQVGDVLVSNIRPYFKKIWRAKYNGGCSNDVLVFRAKKNVDSRYLYYLLANDRFFEYATANSKGTKMPRGDRKAIMKYACLVFPQEIQCRIGRILCAIDEKIEKNILVNKNLEETVAIQYLRLIETAEGRSKPLGELVDICKKSFNPLKEPERLLEHYSIPAFDETRFPVFEKSSSIKSNKFLIDRDCFMISKLNPTTKRVWKPLCLTQNSVCSTEFIVYKAKDKRLTNFLFSVVNSDAFTDFMCTHVTGSTGSRQRTTPGDTLLFEVPIPSEEDLKQFLANANFGLELIQNNIIQNNKLKELRDALLPKLMSGEIDVSQVEL